MRTAKGIQEAITGRVEFSDGEGEEDTEDEEGLDENTEVDVSGMSDHTPSYSRSSVAPPAPRAIPALTAVTPTDSISLQKKKNDSNQVVTKRRNKSIRIDHDDNSFSIKGYTKMMMLEREQEQKDKRECRDEERKRRRCRELQD